jgi:hypothetical protein
MGRPPAGEVRPLNVSYVQVGLAQVRSTVKENHGTLAATERFHRTPLKQGNHRAYR